ncbi:lipopolysaccharide biosynthesis protein [Vibrio fluvialis]|nr:lipopolysaccharide biosynthesis protein [Vibrio fluvialis]
MSKLIVGLKWSAIDRVFTQFLQLVVMIVLARILGPESYGLVGMLSIFIAIANVFVDSGFSSALIRKKRVSESDYSTVFYFNFLVAIFIYVLLFIFSKSIAQFFSEQELEAILKVQGLVVITNSLSIIQKTKLTIEMNFRTQSIVTITSVIISGIVSIVLAFNGLGVWCIVINSLLFSLSSVIIYFIVTPWFPRSKFDFNSFFGLFSFSKNLLSAALLNVVFDNLYNIMIGKVYSSLELGLFSQAKMLTTIPTNTFSSIVQRVTYRHLSELNSREELTENFINILNGVCFFFFPLIVTFSFFSGDIVLTIFGSEWEGASKLIAIMSYCYVFYPVHAINLNILNVKGRSDLFLKIEIAKKIVILTLLIITININLTYVCLGMVCYSLLATYLNAQFTRDYVNVSFFEQLKIILPYLIIALFSGWCSYSLSNMFDNHFIRLAFYLVSLLIYLLLCFVFFNGFIKKFIKYTYKTA